MHVSDSHTEWVAISAKETKYPIHIGSDLNLLFHLKPLLQNNEVLLVIDHRVGQLYLTDLLQCLHALDLNKLEVIQLPPGEDSKNFESVQRILNKLIEKQFTMDSILMAVGGGVCCDVTAFAAACYMRGVDVLHCPTTLLAQVDAAIGGKAGINHPLGKNLIGAFHHPKMVLCDSKWLATLPAREFNAGMAEVIKYGCILSSSFFDWIVENTPLILKRNSKTLEAMIKNCVAIKAKIVGMDDRDKGHYRPLLNFGHTIGHALEAFAQYNDSLHGETVAIGMMVAAKLSNHLFHLPQATIDALRNLLHSFELPTKLPSDVGSGALMKYLAFDKKKRKDGNRWILLQSLGQATIKRDVPETLVQDVLIELGASP